MPKRATPPKRGPPPNALFDDDSGEGESAPIDVDDDDDEGTSATATEALPTSLPFDARLVVEKGDYAGKVLKLGGGVAMIGRSSKCELSLKGSTGVSRRHCKVQLVAERFVVIDLESRNGTVVNGETVSRKFLSDGDLLEIGDEHVRFIAKPKAFDDIDDIDDHPTALGVSPAAVSGAKKKLPSPPPTRPDRQEPSSAQRTAPKGAQSPPKKPPPLARDDDPPPFIDRTASFVPDPALLARGAFVEDLAPQAYDDDERLPPPLDERSGPYTLHPRRSGSFFLRALLAFALLVVVALGVAAWDLALGERRLIALAQAHAPAVAAQLERIRVTLTELLESVQGDDATLADGTPVDVTPDDVKPRVDDTKASDAKPLDDTKPIDAKPPDDPKTIDTKPVDTRAIDLEDATPLEGAKPLEDTKPLEDAKRVDGTSVPSQGAVVVKAASGGRVSAVRVKVGAVVKTGQTLVVLEGAGALRRKLESLREEERAFEQAVKKGNKAARRDLEAVRVDIAELARRVRGVPLVSDVAGTIVEVLVTDGETIKSGQPLVSVTP